MEPTDRPPADAEDPFGWLTGLILRETHTQDPETGLCRGCGTAGPCTYRRAGYAIMRAALANPGTLPLNPPGG